MKEETGIEAGAMTTLHTHDTFKNEHVYVIHVARAPDGVAPRPSRGQDRPRKNIQSHTWDFFQST